MIVASKPVKRPSDGPIANKADITIRERRGPPQPVRSHAAYQVDQESQVVAAAEGLASLLTRMGIGGSVGLSLLERVDLLVDPAPALAWWWFALVQEGVDRPGALAFNYLARHEPPHPDYLALAQSWPAVSAADRAGIEKMLLRDASAEDLSRRWSQPYPGLTEGAFVAFMWLYAAAPAELGYAKARGIWGRHRES